MVAMVKATTGTTKTLPNRKNINMSSEFHFGGALAGIFCSVTASCPMVEFLP